MLCHAYKFPPHRPRKKKKYVSTENKLFCWNLNVNSPFKIIFDNIVDLDLIWRRGRGTLPVVSFWMQGTQVAVYKEVAPSLVIPFSRTNFWAVNIFVICSCYFYVFSYCCTYIYIYGGHFAWRCLWQFVCFINVTILSQHNHFCCGVIDYVEQNSIYD